MGKILRRKSITRKKCPPKVKGDFDPHNRLSKASVRKIVREFEWQINEDNKAKKLGIYSYKMSPSDKERVVDTQIKESKKNIEKVKSECTRD